MEEHFKNTFVEINYFPTHNTIYHRVYDNTMHQGFDINLKLDNNDLFLDIYTLIIFRVKGTELRLTKAKELMDQLRW